MYSQLSATTSPYISELVESPLEIEGEKLLYYHSATHEFQLSEQTTPEDIVSAFSLYTKKSPNFGFAREDVWIAFIIENPHTRSISGYLQFDNPIIDVIDVYYWDQEDHQFKITGQTGDQRDFSMRSLDSRYPTVFTSIPADQQSFFLVRMNNGGEQFHFGLSFQTSKTILEQDHFHQFFFGIYFGILLFVLLFNVFLYFSMKEKLSLYYIGYLFSLGILQLSLNGFGKEFVWTNSGFLANHINPLFASMGVFFLILFVRSFLQLKKILPKIDRSFVIISYVVLLNSVLSVIPNAPIYYFSVLAINVITLLLTLAIIPVALYAWKQHFKSARYFTLAFLVLIIAVSAFVLKNFGVIESNPFSDYGMQYGSALEVILLSVAIVDRFKQLREKAIKRLNEVNEFRKRINEELEIKIRERTREVVQQKQKIEGQHAELEFKNKEMVSSISYARRIQDAILPSLKKLDQSLPEYGILYIPRDIVAGDFYWLKNIRKDDQNYICFAVADCTGHGVPGAMMSVLCHNALNSALDEVDQVTPGKILDKVDELLKEDLSGTENQIRDGMDISLICWNTTTQEVFWAGANNALWIFSEHKDTIREVAPDKQAIGWGENKTPFTSHAVSLLPGDTLVLYTDGFADQFGGEKGKKYKSRNLKNYILNLQSSALPQLTDQLSEEFSDWKQQEEQVDDVCIMTVRLF